MLSRLLAEAALPQPHQSLCSVLSPLPRAPCPIPPAKGKDISPRYAAGVPSTSQLEGPQAQGVRAQSPGSSTPFTRCSHDPTGA